MVVRRAALAVSAVALALLPGGCGRYEVPVAGGHGGESPAETPQPETTATPDEQELVVTFRDVPEVAAYEVVDGACEGLDLPDGEQVQLVVHDAADPDGEPLASVRVPSRATLLEDGACETSFEVTVPRAETYDLGVAVPGRGIADPADPENEPVEATTSPQEVTVLR